MIFFVLKIHSVCSFKWITLCALPNKIPFWKSGVTHDDYSSRQREFKLLETLSHHLCLWCLHTHTQPKCRSDPLTSFSIIHFFDSFLFRLQVQHPPAKFGVNSTHTRTDNVSWFPWVNLIIFAPILWCLSTWLIRLLLWIKWIIWCSNKFRHAKQKKNQLLI